MGHFKNDIILWMELNILSTKTESNGMIQAAQNSNEHN